MYMLCMVGSGDGASKWAEMLIGHVWGGPVVGTTYKYHPSFLSSLSFSLPYSPSL